MASWFETLVYVLPSSFINGWSNDVWPDSNCPSNHSITGGWSFNQLSDWANLFIWSSKHCLAFALDSPGKTPSRPSAMMDSGTVECHCPPSIVPIFIGATLSLDW